MTAPRWSLYRLGREDEARREELGDEVSEAIDLEHAYPDDTIERRLRLMERLRSESRGAAAVIVALLIPVIVMTLALTIDSGLRALSSARGSLAADSASLAGAGVCLDGASSGEADGVARWYVEQNGSDVVSVVADCSPGGRVEVVVENSWPRFLGGWGAVQETAVADWGGGAVRLVS